MKRVSPREGDDYDTWTISDIEKAIEVRLGVIQDAKKDLVKFRRVLAKMKELEKMEGSLKSKRSIYPKWGVKESESSRFYKPRELDGSPV